MQDAGTNRRPLQTRSKLWAQRLAAALARSRVTPDQISLASLAVAALGAWLLYSSPGPLGLVGAAACIQLRLLCNMLDGMVAVEGGRKSPYGDLYNELPDRIADILIIVAYGYAVALPLVGWLGALAAVLTAYVRAFGGSLGLPQDFRGPMAKPHRMAALTLGCLVGAAEAPLNGTQYAMALAIYVVAIGAFLTCWTRTLAIAARLRERAR